MKLVSIIIPVYNVESYLEDCLNSVLSQTYQNIEVILIDDGSSDHSGQVCDDYAAKHDAFTVIHQANQGQAAARNNGIKIARGDYLCFVDSDDLLHPQYVEILLNVAIDYNVPISVCGFIGSESPPVFSAITDATTEKVLINDAELLRIATTANRSCYRVCCYVVWGKLIKRELIKENFDDLFTAGRLFEDNAVVPKLLIMSGSIAVIEEELYYNRWTPTGIMHSKMSIKKLDQIWAYFECFDYCRTSHYTQTAEFYFDMIAEYSFHHALTPESPEIRRQIRRMLWHYFIQYPIYFLTHKCRRQIRFATMIPGIIEINRAYRKLTRRSSSN